MICHQLTVPCFQSGAYAEKQESKSYLNTQSNTNEKNSTAERIVNI